MRVPPATIPIIYVAGPYRAASLWGVTHNIRQAKMCGSMVLAMGAMPLIPHGITGPELDGFALGGEDFMLDATLELMRRCDAVILVEGWEKSVGTQGEVAEAKRLKIPVFENIACLKSWVGAWYSTLTQAP